MKKWRVIAVFLFALAATTTISPSHAVAAILESRAFTPGVFVCADEIRETSSLPAIVMGDCIGVLSFGYSVEGQVQESTSLDKFSSRTGGPVTIGDVVITKAFDGTFTPMLIMSSLEGRMWRELRVEVYNASDPDCFPGGSCGPVISIVLNGVLVKSIVTTAVSGMDSGNPIVLETVTVTAEFTQVFFAP